MTAANPPGLGSLLMSFLGVLSELREHLDCPVPTMAPYNETCPPVHSDGQRMLVVHLQNEWAAFCESLLQQSCLGGTATTSGTAIAPVRLPAGFSSVASFFKAKSTEVVEVMPWKANWPIWHNPDYVIKLAYELNPDNVRQIALGLGGSSQAKNINIVRNRLMHPSHKDAQFTKYVERLGAQGLDAHSVLTFELATGKRVFEEWLDDLESAAVVATT